MKILHENCDPELGNDRTLPYTAYLVEYEIDGVKAYDITTSDKKSEMFDHYWDKYREGLKGWKQTEGRVNPRMWGVQPKETKKKR